MNKVTLTTTHEEKIRFAGEFAYKSVKFHDMTPEEIGEWITAKLSEGWDVYKLFLRKER